jgi:hypothetical protein
MIHVSRRTMLSGMAGGVAVTMTGCSGPVASLGGENPDDAARRLTAVSEQQLVAAYDAVIAAIPSLSGELGTIRDQHTQHLAALGDTQAASGSPAAIDTAARPAALRALRKLERGAASERTMAAVSVSAADLVQLLTRIGASEAGHAAYLSGVR